MAAIPAAMTLEGGNLNARFYAPVVARFISSDRRDPDLPGVGTNR
jgi:hypothetical protein